MNEVTKNVWAFRQKNEKKNLEKEYFSWLMEKNFLTETQFHEMLNDRLHIRA